MAVQRHSSVGVTPRWLVVSGNTALLIVILGVTVVLLPHSLVAKHAMIRKNRAIVMKSLNRIIHIWKLSPLYKISVFIGRKCLFGRLSSRCKVPYNVKAHADGTSFMVLSWSQHLPGYNAFHDERYVMATRKTSTKEDSDTSPWCERELAEDDIDFQSKGAQMKAYIDQLPENSTLQVRVCATNCWGRSRWSEEVTVTTLARSKNGGFWGPLGKAAATLAEVRQRYHWTQKRGEVTLKVPIGETWRARDINVKVTPQRIEILHSPGAGRPVRVADGLAAPPPLPDHVLLAGSFPKRVKVDEVLWDVEEDEGDGRHIALQMMKVEEMDKWDCFVEGDAHPRIDVATVRIFTKDMEALGPRGIDILE
eukprot:TRINITY_DN2883_c0_g1_i3.p1 TRINITY_DN2883_c0_g1~~TRINITY_DN2883_c0_g1_i3.p1  ORF type:complete len:365 (-),score=45.20 TRINITY_DN2883_c0_g1_i3:68-1162(-)